MDKKKQRILMGGALAAGAGLAVILGLGPIAELRAEAKQREMLQGSYDPFSFAKETNRKIEHREAGIPSQCYTKTEGRSNPCYTCHTGVHFPNDMNDWLLQVEYAFSEEGSENHWTNLFKDRREKAESYSEAEVFAYVRADNYAALRRVTAGIKDFPGYLPDLDFEKGFDEDGIARDGSGWRAFRYKPFPGTFWPTNGSTDDVLIRLPEEFRSLGGKYNRDVYVANLALLELAVASNPQLEDSKVVVRTAQLDERTLGTDLDRNGKLGTVTQVHGLFEHFLGDATDVRVVRGLFPRGTEFLHSVRYIDPDEPSLIAKRMKELRYSKKTRFMDPSQLIGVYNEERDERDAGRLPVFQGDAISGVRNKHGWVLQAYIEDAKGRLRLQTHQEHMACLGCHSNLGVTVDNTFSFARKVPGEEGWAYQDVRGIPDVPQLGHEQPEFLEYLERVGAGDEFRENDELMSRFFENGHVKVDEVRRAAPGGDKDFAWLVAPSDDRAMQLNRAYMALVGEQRFDLGRDAPISPPKNVFARIEEPSTGLVERNLVFQDGKLHLDWEK